MTEKFKQIVDETIKLEGGYTNDPKDSGGETKYGISKKAHPDVILNVLTKEEAKEIYEKEYWNKYYELLPTLLAFKLFDMGVLFGTKVAVKLFQESIVYAGKKTIKIDGDYGPITAAAVASLNPLVDTILEDYKKRLAMRINFIIIKSPKNFKFKNGWLKRINYKPFKERI